MTAREFGRRMPLDIRLTIRLLRIEVLAVPRALWIWLGILAVPALLGAAAAARSLIPGDKAIGTTPTVEWGVLIVGYVFFAITTSGLCLASSLGTVFGIERFRPLERRHAILAVLCLSTAFGIIALDLHYPIRLVFGAVLNPSPSSPMWWMGVFYGIYFGSLLLEVWSMFRGHARIHGWACLFSSIMAIIAPSTLGAVFGVLGSRPFWSGPFTPLLMLASAFVSGTALLGVAFGVVIRFRLTGVERAATTAMPAIRLTLSIGLLAASVLVARELAAGMTSSDPGLAAATRALVAGPLALPFWTLRVVGGLAIPLLLLALPWTRTPVGVFSASVLAITGIFVDRLTFVMAGQIAPTTAVAGVVSAPYASYVPSAVEIGILVGAVAFVAMAFTLAERYLDLGETDVHAVLSPAAIRGYRDQLRSAFRGGVLVVEPQAAWAETPAATDGVAGPDELAPEPMSPADGEVAPAAVEAPVAEEVPVGSGTTPVPVATPGPAALSAGTGPDVAPALEREPDADRTGAELVAIPELVPGPKSVPGPGLDSSMTPKREQAQGACDVRWPEPEPLPCRETAPEHPTRLPGSPAGPPDPGATEDRPGGET